MKRNDAAGLLLTGITAFIALQTGLLLVYVSAHEAQGLYTLARIVAAYGTALTLIGSTIWIIARTVFQRAIKATKSEPKLSPYVSGLLLVLQLLFLVPWIWALFS